MANSGKKYAPIFWLLTLRTMKGIMSVTYVLSGYSLPKLQLTMLLHEAENQIYDMYSPTWPSAVRRVMKPKGQRMLSSSKKRKKTTN